MSFFFLPFSGGRQTWEAGTGCAGQGGRVGVCGCTVSTRSVGVEWIATGRRFHGSGTHTCTHTRTTPPSPKRTAAPYHPAWGETNTGSSFEKGEFPWISPSCVDEQTDTLIEFERKAERERKRRGHGEIGAERWSVTCRGRTDVWLLRNRFLAPSSPSAGVKRDDTGWVSGGFTISPTTSQLITGPIFKPCAPRDVFHHITRMCRIFLRPCLT